MKNSFNAAFIKSDIGSINAYLQLFLFNNKKLPADISDFRLSKIDGLKDFDWNSEMKKFKYLKIDAANYILIYQNQYGIIEYNSKSNTFKDKITEKIISENGLKQKVNYLITILGIFFSFYLF